MRRDQQMSSNVHPNFQDKKINDEVGLVSEVLIFTSANPRTLRTSKNAAELARRCRNFRWMSVARPRIPHTENEKM